MDSHIIVRFATDTIDSSILLLAQIATVLAGFSFAVSILFLVDYFKRHGWQYHHHKKKFVDVVIAEPVQPGVTYEADLPKKLGRPKKVKEVKKTAGSPF